MKKKERQRIKKASKLLVSALMVGALSLTSNVMAADVTGWDGFKAAVNDTNVSEINVEADINFGADTLTPITRNLSIIGDTTGRYLSGNDTYGGLQIGTDADKDDTLILQNISMQHFKKSGTYADGAAINNKAIIAGIKGNFSHNSANSGGAIYNFKGTIDDIIGDFESNSATTNGGAISNFDGSSKIGNITGNFKGNYTGANGYGGAIYNSGTIENITGDFENNYTASTTYGGGAILNTKTINISTSNEKHTILFKGNYITNLTGKGGAIWNNGLTGTAVGLYAIGENDTITFVGGEDDIANSKYNIDGIYNAKTLNINGHENTDADPTVYAGTVNLYTVDGSGTTNIWGGTVGVKGDFKQKTLDVKSGATLDLAKGQINSVTVNTLNFADGAKLKLDVGKVGGVDSIDNITYTSGTGSIAVNSINLMNDINEGSLTWLSGGSGVADNTSTIKIATSNAVYTFTKNTTPGILDVTKATAVSLPDIIQNHAEITSYSLIDVDETMTANLGTLANPTEGKRSFTINGNGHTLNGQKSEGENVAGITVLDGQTFKVENATMKNFTTAITNGSGATTNINGVTFTNNTTDIDNAGTLNLSGTNTIDTITNNGTVNFNGTLKGSDTGLNLIQNGGVMNFSTTAIEGITSTSPINNFTMNGGLVNIADNSINTLNVDNLNLTGDTKFIVDVDFRAEGQPSDMLFADHVNVTGDKNLLVGFNILNDMEDDVVGEEFTFATGDLKDHIQLISNQIGKGTNNPYQTEYYTPIYKYDVQYKIAPAEDGSMEGILDFSRDAFNPSILAAAVGAQLGGYLNQLNSYENAFNNMDMYMLMTQKERTAMKMRNKLAAAGVGADLVTYDPNQRQEEQRGIFFRPYASFEKVNLQGGPRVENNMYGTFLGGDSDLIELKHGWDMVYSGYASYDGSHQNYDGVSIWQNGGHLGGTTVFYKDNFFTGLTANVGASVAEANTMYGNENFTLLMAGIANKTGYNWELFKGRFIIQPSMLLSYSFVHTFDYTNGAGVDIHSSPLNAIQLAPQLKFIGNLPNGWQPYASIQMVWNIMDDTKFKAANVNLPQLSVEPYVQYGVGVQKRWGERFNGFFQTMIRNGGRTGIAFSAGFRWAIGNKPSEKSIKASTPELPKTKINLSGRKVLQLLEFNNFK